MSVTESTDQDLMEELRHGRALALAVLFDRYGRLIFRIARQILHDDAEAEDLTQDVLLEVYRKAGQYDASRGTVKTWLLQYAYHRGFNRRKYLALRRFYDDYPAGALEETKLAGEGDQREGLSPHEWWQILQRGMDELGACERQIIGMVAF